jgi:hypothetical protein
LPREACKSRLTVDAWQNMESKLFWPFYDNVLSCWIPADHVVVFWTFKETKDMQVFSLMK